MGFDGSGRRKSRAKTMETKLGTHEGNHNIRNGGFSHEIWAVLMINIFGYRT
jgi:hypothetical protein